MWITKKGIGKLLGILVLLITSASLFGEEPDKESKVESKSKSNFVLTIKDNLISLDAKDASLKAIIEEIGSRMKIDVVASIPEELKITTKFDKLSIEAAIKRLREYANVLYVKDSDKREAKITKIVVIPKQVALQSQPAAKEYKPTERSVKAQENVNKENLKEKPKRPDAFEFEFDPSEFEEDEKDDMKRE